MSRVRRPELTSKLLSLIGGIATGMVLTMSLALRPASPGPEQALRLNLGFDSHRSGHKPFQKPPVKTPDDDTEAMGTIRISFSEPVTEFTATHVITVPVTASLPDQTGRMNSFAADRQASQPLNRELSLLWHPDRQRTPRRLPGVVSRPEPEGPASTGME